VVGCFGGGRLIVYVTPWSGSNNHGSGIGETTQINFDKKVGSDLTLFPMGGLQGNERVTLVWGGFSELGQLSAGFKTQIIADKPLKIGATKPKKTLLGLTASKTLRREGEVASFGR